MTTPYSTDLESLIAARGKRAIKGQINPWELPQFAPTVQGIRTTGARTLEDLYGSMVKSGVSGPAAGTLLEKGYQGTQGNVLNLANSLANLPETYIGQGIQAEEQAQGRATRESEFIRNMVEQRKMRHLQEKTAKAQSMQTPFTSCCFIFIEGEGQITEPVRIFRDRFFNSNSYVAAGYRHMAGWLVPLMKRNKLIKQLVRKTMTQPMSSFARFYYFKDMRSVVYAPVGVFWCFIWGHSARLLGVR